MASQSLRGDEHLRRVGTHLPKITKSRLSRYQLNVVAGSAADVVSSAGGWLFDRAMAGWEVNVLLTDLNDVRALRILGAREVDRGNGLTSLVDGPEQAAGLAVAADLLRADGRVRDEVLAIVGSGLTEVALWGERWSADVGGQVEAVRYRLSAAARVFKGHALAAAGLGDVPTCHTEGLFRAGYRPLDSDLTPIG